MKHLLKFKIFENISEEELNRILDKINKLGMDSLSWEEKKKLKSFKGEFSDPDNHNDVSFDKDGNLLVGGKSPLHHNPPSDNDYGYTDPQQITPRSNTNIDTYTKRLREDNIFILNDSKKTTVALDRWVQGLDRIYFIIFKQIKDTKNRASCIKLAYNYNRSGRGADPKNWNISIYDNYNNEITFNQLTFFLREHNIDYDTFNEAFYYIEENYNNR